MTGLDFWSDHYPAFVCFLRTGRLFVPLRHLLLYVRQQRRDDLGAHAAPYAAARRHLQVHAMSLLRGDQEVRNYHGMNIAYF